MRKKMHFEIWGSDSEKISGSGDNGMKVVDKGGEEVATCQRGLPLLLPCLPPIHIHSMQEIDSSTFFERARLAIPSRHSVTHSVSATVHQGKREEGRQAGWVELYELAPSRRRSGQGTSFTT